MTIDWKLHILSECRTLHFSAFPDLGFLERTLLFSDRFFFIGKLTHVPSSLNIYILYVSSTPDAIIFCYVAPFFSCTLEWPPLLDCPFVFVVEEKFIML